MIETAELIAIVALSITAIIAIAAAAYALGSLPKRSEFNALRQEVNNLQQDVNDLRVEVNEKIDESHEKIKAEVIAEIRRSHRQLMYAIVHHRHPEPGGPPVFAEPADFELVVADD